MRGKQDGTCLLGKVPHERWPATKSLLAVDALGPSSSSMLAVIIHTRVLDCGATFLTDLPLRMGFSERHECYQTAARTLGNYTVLEGPA